MKTNLQIIQDGEQVPLYIKLFPLPVFRLSIEIYVKMVSKVSPLPYALKTISGMWLFKCSQ